MITRWAEQLFFLSVFIMSKAFTFEEVSMTNQPLGYSGRPGFNVYLSMRAIVG